jgi:hypothetical protein
MYKNEKIEAIYFGIHDKLSNDTFSPENGTVLQFISG